MNLKILTIIVALLVVGFGTYYFQNNKEVSDEDIIKTKELTKNNLTIVYTNEGFNPKEIKIKKDETIKFINLSDRKMWVASNDHPAHDIYPEFDQKEISLRDAEYSFKFEKTGTWGFHNHLYAGHEGTVIVE